MGIATFAGDLAAKKPINLLREQEQHKCAKAWQ